MKILQIIPRLSPPQCGVGDYSLLLAQSLEREQDIRTHFLVCDSDWKQDSKLSCEPLSIQQLRKRTASEFENTLLKMEMSFDALVLQFSGYGFAKKGAPLWLASGLARFRSQIPQKPLVTMYHELYATGPVTSSAFWLSHLQRCVLRKISAVSSNVITNRSVYAKWLQASKQQLDVKVIPVFSNLGENPRGLPPSQRRPEMVVFSSGFDIEKNWKFVISFAEQNQLQAIHWVGSRPPPQITNCSSTLLKQRGFMSASEASSLLSETRFGYLDYYDGYLAKSGIFAAFVSHGVAVIMPKVNHSEQDGLHHGTHYITINSNENYSSNLINQVASNARDWYSTHDLSSTAKAYREILQQT